MKLSSEQIILSRPSVRQLEAELRRLRRLQEIIRSVRNTVCVLIVVAAIITMIFTLWLPILQVRRGGMTPALRDGDALVFITTGTIKRGDIIAFYDSSQVLIKRVVAVAGDWIDIRDDGAVELNNNPLDEPYVVARSGGEHTIELPRQVSDNQYFVLGDNRQTSLDSRSAEIGMIQREQIIGKALFRIWPLGMFGSIH